MPRMKLPKPQRPAQGFQPSLPGTERDHVSSRWLLERCCCVCGERFRIHDKKMTCVLHDTGTRFAFIISSRSRLGALASYKLAGHQAHKSCAVLQEAELHIPSIGVPGVTTKQRIQIFVCPDCEGPD